jgi:hypothetical protein
VDPRAGLDDMEKRKFLTLPGLEFRILGHPARSQSLYRLSYPGSLRVLSYSHYLSLAFALSTCFLSVTGDDGRWRVSGQCK